MIPSSINLGKEKPLGLMSRAHLYAYLKTSKSNSPFYVHLTLQEDVKKLRIYYHCAWWRTEKVEPEIFEYWMKQLAAMGPALVNQPTSKKKSPIVTRLHSVKVKGKCRVHSTMLSQLVGFVEQDTASVFPASFYGYVNEENKLIEIEVTIDYAHLGKLVEELRKLGIFSTDPNKEYVRQRLAFFKMSYILDFVPSSNALAPAVHLSQHVSSPGAVPVEPARRVDEFKLDPDSQPGSRLKDDVRKDMDE